MSKLNGQSIAFLATDGVEQIELTDPWQAVEDAGGRPVLVAPKEGTIQGFDKDEKDKTFEVDVVVGEADAEDYDALVLPGGVINPDKLRMDDEAVDFVKAISDRGKPIAVICHGPWTLIEADLVDGRDITSWPSLETDLVNAGASWTDREVVVCQTGPVLISSRKPEDLPAFNRTLIEEFSKTRVGG
jgi:protease I